MFHNTHFMDLKICLQSEEAVNLDVCIEIKIPVSKSTQKPELLEHTYEGLYAVHRLMDGISSAPAVWQANIKGDLGEALGIYVEHDDPSFYGKYTEVHLSGQANIMKRLQNDNIRLRKKCTFP